jgi:hypothetical protein
MRHTVTKKVVEICLLCVFVRLVDDGQRQVLKGTLSWILRCQMMIPAASPLSISASIWRRSLGSGCRWAGRW